MLPPKGLDFSENKKFAALAERRDARDIVGIYYAGNDWKMVNQIEIDTVDLQDIKWTNGDSAILTWDSALESRILVYSVATGSMLSRFEPDMIGLGIKKLTIAPSKNLFASGMYDNSIVLYNNLTA